MASPIGGTQLSPATLTRLRGQAEDLEGVFLNTLMKEMFSSVSSSEGGFAEDTWRGMQAEQLANTLARSGGIGLADSLMGDLIAMQEAAQRAAPINGATP
jgi:flagellar protein FlgJ